MKGPPSMYHKSKEEVFIYATPSAGASLIRAKSMTLTAAATVAATAAAATEGCRAHHIFG